MEDKILIQEFIDADLDVFGIYAFGHHDRDIFLEKINKERLNSAVHEDGFRHSWIRLKNNTLEEFLDFQPGTQPATVVEFLG